MTEVTETVQKKEPKICRGQRSSIVPWDDDEWYEEMIDEIFTRAEQSVGAQIHPTNCNGGDG